MLEAHGGGTSLYLFSRYAASRLTISQIVPAFLVSASKDRTPAAAPLRFLS
ncbi:hypothetical protein ppKF707_2705 [Metapseudomonas furukawaii]|uniref:Uncharacterized protein n=1 Tax=Metapseudomonas furukawaii TaxID=1149133 RepID=A0AAD1FFE9_METFU|nr:hypothetical protein ppKF707_2705 [Pseudomonas furukawaii]BAU74860.1 hypothetical protein KF707C_31720 [Pseudomonas furukawaii]